MRTWMGMIALVSLMGTTACEEGPNDARLDGTYALIVAELEDTCDDEQNQFAATMTIQDRGGDLWEVVFGTAGTLTGSIDATGILQVGGMVNPTVVVDGVPEVVNANMVMQIGQLRTGEIEASGRLTFNGTFPGVEGECIQTFVAEGDRHNRAPALLTGPEGR